MALASLGGSLLCRLVAALLFEVPMLRLPLFAFAVASLLTAAAAQVAWTRASPLASPPAQYGQDLVYDDARGVVWTLRSDSTGATCETWGYDGTAWFRATTNPLPHRDSARLCYDSKRGVVVLFGGQNLDEEFDDTWEFDGATWTRRVPATVPPPRYAPHMAYDARRGVTVLFGGWQSFVFGSEMRHIAYQDTWEWDGVDWVERTTTSGPGRLSTYRSQQGYSDMCFDEDLGVTVLVGGWKHRSGIAEPFAETWEWDGTAWTSHPTPSWADPFAPTVPVGAAYDPTRRRVVTSGLRAYEREGRTWIDRGITGMSGPIAFDLRRSVAVSFLQDRPTGWGTWEYGAIQPAGYVTYGAGCPGTHGLPSLAPRPARWPYPGEALALQVRGVPGAGPSFAFLGASRTRWLGHGLPLDLAALGMPGCALLAAPEAVVPMSPVSGGASLELPIPTTAALTGARVHGQVLVVDPGANAAGAVLSDAVEAMVGSK